MDHHTPTVVGAYERLAATGLVRRLLELARDEDLGSDGMAAGAGDVTSVVAIDGSSRASLVLRAREPMVVAGLAAMPEMLRIFAPGAAFRAACEDGQSLSAGDVLGEVGGPRRELLALERTMLNLLSRLSGIATRTAEFVRAIPPGSKARLYDTRKTTPGLRVLEKYAVRCGGGFCHRLGLHDAVLIKDNHLAGVGPDGLGAFVADAARRARAMRPDLSFVEVEVDSLEQLDVLLGLEAGLVDIVLLDNMDVGRISGAVARRDRLNPRLELEVSGGVTLQTIPSIAATGVERISTGSITHHAVWVDIGLDAA